MIRKYFTAHLIYFDQNISILPIIKDVINKLYFKIYLHSCTTYRLKNCRETLNLIVTY
ncbi:hypothetical protein HMPREF9138_01881 [Prevotella histicola F0411]|uniref:Uncharacterized protein n=1 Tax=Prevotella histicola F0411 TaxID=857291 RepID=G6AIF4_9BACT|nr:hypothetical protein HMPREF9138_01881 [Prevotella histicola F0411]